MVSGYQQFVKDNIAQFKHLPAKERMKAVAQLYKKGSEAPMPAKKGRGRPKKGGVLITGAGVEQTHIPLDDLMGKGITGAGMKKGRGRPKKLGGAMVESPTMSGSVGGMMTAGKLDNSADDFLHSFSSMFNLKGKGHL